MCSTRLRAASQYMTVERLYDRIYSGSSYYLFNATYWDNLNYSSMQSKGPACGDQSATLTRVELDFRDFT